MRRLLSILILLVSLMAPVVAQLRLTLQQCYELVNANYPLLQRVDIVEKTKEYTLRNAALSYAPQLSFSAKATYQSETVSFPFEIPLPGVEMPTFSKDQYGLTADLSQTIWDGGAMRAHREIARQKASVDQDQIARDMYPLRERVNQLYFGILLQQKMLVQNELHTIDIQNNMDKITSMLDNGSASLSDLQTIRAELLTLQQQRVELIRSQKALMDMLSFMIQKRVTAADELIYPEEPKLVPDNKINRPELRLFESQKRAIESQKQLLLSGWMPRFSLFFQGGYGRPSLNLFNDDFAPYFITGLRFSWSLSNLYTWSNSKKINKLDQTAVDVQRQLFVYNTELDLTKQQQEILKYDELLRSDQELIGLRRDIKQAAESKLTHGMISINDLIKEINAESRARIQYSIHQINRLSALYTYQYITNN